MYQLIKPIIMQTEASVVKRITDNTFIPLDPTNADYQIYLKWLDGYELSPDGWVKTSESNTPLPADPVE